MSINQTIALALAEAALPHDQCLSCERQGLPILPLRRALVPDTRPSSVTTVAGSLHISTKMGLRTLRAGYLYVLLDQRVWHAYTVNEQGHLRRFNPYEPPDGPPSPLPEKCAQADHDMPSAFLNIDTDTYGNAWLAFSSDAWPVSVLDVYKQGKAPAHRFEGLDLIQARSDPGLLGIAMTPDNPQVDEQVFEYAQQACAPFDSAHGFHSRWLRRFALRGYLVNAMNRHALENGVLAVVLDDTIGLVQEYNHQRLNWVVKRQVWREDPMRAYQLQTSQILQVIRATHREWAAQSVPSLAPMTGDGPPVFVDPQVERQRLVERRQQASDERLEERYHEPQRAAFQAEYDRQEVEFQRYIDKDARAYVALFDTPMFKVAEQYDYDGGNRESGVAYAKTMALCLGGGITDAMVASTQPQRPAPGTTEALWLNWLQDPGSPPYRALLMRDRALLAGLLPSFSASEPINWNDSGKFYGLLSNVIASDDAGLRMRNTLKQAITETQGALNAASQRLMPWMAPGIHKAVRHLNSATQFLYNGVHLIELEVRMKLGEYYALQSAHLRELQHKANASIAEARDRMHRGLDDFELGSMKTVRKVRPIIQHGLMSLAVLDPKFTDTMISVSVWVEGKAEQVHDRLFKEASLGVTQASSAAQIALVDISVAAGTLEANARKLLQGMQITSQQAAQLVRTSYGGLRGVAGSWELLLAMGGLYLQSDSLGKNLERAEAEIGSKAKEAKLALQGSVLGVLGAQIELTGIVMRAGARTISASWAKGALGAGQSIIKVGAVLSAVAGLFDAAKAISASKRAAVVGDGFAKSQYKITAFIYFLGTGAFAAAVAHPFFWGALGVAVILTLGAYSLSAQAAKNESTALELWVRRCFFGKSDGTSVVRWDAPEYIDIAFAELNAITLAVEAEINFETGLATDPTIPRVGGFSSLIVEQKIKFGVVLPRYTDASAYRCCLIVHRQGDGVFPGYKGGETIFVDNYQDLPVEPISMAAKFSDFAAPRWPDYKGDVVINKRRKSYASGGVDVSRLEIVGALDLMPTVGRHTIAAATLLVMYWPDRNLPSAYVEMCVRGVNE
jgi:hypothetical protein